MIDLSEEQEVKEALLAYSFLQIEGDQNYTMESLDDRVEAWLQATFSVTVDFEVRDALGKLRNLGLLHEEEGRLSVIPPKEALIRLDEIWDGLYDFED